MDFTFLEIIDLKNQLLVSLNSVYLLRVVYKEISFWNNNLWVEIHFHSWTIRGVAIVGINDKGSMHQIPTRNSNSTLYFPSELEVKNLNAFKDRMSGWRGAHSWKNLRKYSHCLVHLFYWFYAIANVPQFQNLDRLLLYFQFDRTEKNILLFRLVEVSIN